MQSWLGFFQSVTGASATLAGMVVVAISINLTRILETPYLPDRAAAALIPLGGVLALAILALIPGQPIQVFGGEALAGGVLMSLCSALLISRFLPMAKDQPPSRMVAHLLISFGPSLPFIVAGVLLLDGHPAGLYWAAPAVVLAIMSGLLNTWVLLIEILR